MTSGYMYRGTAIPNLAGAYMFADCCTGGVFAVHGTLGQGWSPRLELDYQPWRRQCRVAIAGFEREDEVDRHAYTFCALGE